MENILSEIGRLKIEMLVDFTELENQIAPTLDQVSEDAGKIDIEKKMASNVERGFLAVKGANVERYRSNG
ncbi:MAG: hypothetical protein AAGI25_20840 [Bacteroidota bacterium]